MTKRPRRWPLLVLAIVFAITSAAPGAVRPAGTRMSLEWVYRDKIRMGWTPERFEQYQMMKDAGMNAVMPRLELDVPMDDLPHPFDRPLSDHDAAIIADLQRGSALAKKLGLRYFHCLNFAADSQTYEGGIRDNPARYNDGHLPSPVDPVFFKRTILDRVERAMKLLGDKQTYALDAVIIDPEMYTLSGALPGDPDYGRYAFESFLRDTKRARPNGVDSVEARRTWLAEAKLDAEFVQWQFDRMRGLAVQLRELVHRDRPDVILGYIIHEDRLWFKATAAGLSTPEMPVFIGPESTYSGVMDQNMVAYLRQIRDSVGVPCLLVPGVDIGLINKRIPTERLAVLPGNIYQRCQHSEGYWVYAIYNFGDTSEQQKAFFSVLKTVDDALDEQARTGKVVSSLPAAPLPLLLPKGFETVLKQAQSMTAPPAAMPAARLGFQPPMLRGPYVILLWPTPGVRQSITIRADKLGNYLDACNVQLFNRAGMLLQENPVPLGTSRVFWVPDAAGSPCAKAVTAGMNRWVIEEFNGKAMLFAEDVLALNAAGASGGRFYFHVPADRREFGLQLVGDGGETADYSLFDPSGKALRSWKTLKKVTRETINVTQPGIWCVQVDHLVDDGGIGLTDLPNLFALRPEDVMVSRP